MKTILVLGAGRSSSSLINYLLQHAVVHAWNVRVGDLSITNAVDRVGNSPAGQAIEFSMDNTEASRKEIAKADVVISLLPAPLHPAVARLCLQEKKHLLTASYVSDEMKALHEEAVRQGLLFLNECGLDPGIDHMSAMQVMDRVRDSGGTITSFESFTGGLIAPETDPQNPWRYKFTWNPRNVVMAGQGTAKFLQNGKLKYVPYQQLFKRVTPVTVPGCGEFEGYANRDSLKYCETYGLNAVETMIRGTLRNKGYCAAWNVLVQLGCCDESYVVEESEMMTPESFIDSFLTPGEGSVENRLARQCNLYVNGEEMNRLRWSGFFSHEKFGLANATPAQLVEQILQQKWKLNPADKDMIVMWHRFRVKQGAKEKEIQASLVVKGSDSVETAMAKTVGLPLGIASRLLLEKKLQHTGVVIPIARNLYEPILKELASMGIELQEQERIM
jgi:saccharopine dehydrogenase-like NADP-dependent oxidoreductase